MDQNLIDIALQSLEAGEQINPRVSELLLMQLRKERDEGRRKYEAGLETLQVQAGALESRTGLWRIDWSKLETKLT